MRKYLYWKVRLSVRRFRSDSGKLYGGRLGFVRTELQISLAYSGCRSLTLADRPFSTTTLTTLIFIPSIEYLPLHRTSTHPRYSGALFAPDFNPSGQSPHSAGRSISVLVAYLRTTYPGTRSRVCKSMETAAYKPCVSGCYGWLKGKEEDREYFVSFNSQVVFGEVRRMYTNAHMLHANHRA